MSGKKAPESLVRKIERFYTENPHEWLSVDEMSLKFGAPKNSIHTAIWTLRSEGFQLKAITVYCMPPAGESA